MDWACVHHQQQLAGGQAGGEAWMQLVQLEAISVQLRGNKEQLPKLLPSNTSRSISFSRQSQDDNIRLKLKLNLPCARIKQAGWKCSYVWEKVRRVLDLFSIIFQLFDPGLQLRPHNQL